MLNLTSILKISQMSPQNLPNESPYLYLYKYSLDLYIFLIAAFIY